MIRDYKELKIITNNVGVTWKESRGFAPISVSDKLEVAMLSWVTELTDALNIWIDKGLNLTEGELILANTNLGAITECWLKFFYTVFYEDYRKNPKKDRKGDEIEPNKMKFEDLKNFSIGILWDDKTEPGYLYVDNIQHKRNAIHAFNYRDIGNPQDFLNNVDLLCNFVDEIISRLPDIEDYLDYIPAGYIQKTGF